MELYVHIGWVRGGRFSSGKLWEHLMGDLVGQKLYVSDPTVEPNMYAL